MRYWAVNDNNLDNGKLVIKSDLGTSITKGDNIVIFFREYKYVKFYSFGKAIEVIQEENEGRWQEKLYTTTILLGKSELIKHSLTLDDLAYSILKIYRYTRPYLHFRRAYVSLPREDYETIINGDIFWPRTAFGMFINELRTEQRELFIQVLAQYSPEIALQNSDFYTTWSALEDFIKAEYVSSTELMQQIHSNIDLLNRYPEINIDYTKLGLSSDEEKDTDLIAAQEQRLSNFLSATRIEERDVFKELQQRILESKSEARFKRIFREKSWPL